MCRLHQVTNFSVSLVESAASAGLFTFFFLTKNKCLSYNGKPQLGQASNACLFADLQRQYPILKTGKSCKKLHPGAMQGVEGKEPIKTLLQLRQAIGGSRLLVIKVQEIYVKYLDRDITPKL